MVTSMSGSRSRGGTAGDVIPSGYRKGRLQQYDKQQMDVYNRDFENVAPGSYLQRLAGGDQDLFNEIETPALKQFSGLQGNLASRFSGMGQGSRRSSGFQNASTSAASNFAEQLQAQRMGLRRQAMQDLHGMTQDILGRRPYDDFLVEKQQKQGFDWGGVANTALSAGMGFITGGPPGAIAAGATSAVKNFSGGGNPSQGTSYGDKYYPSSSNGYNLPNFKY